MKRYFISKNYSDLYTASSKAKIDIEIIAKRNSFKNIGLCRRNITNKLGQLWTFLSQKIGLFRMPINGIVLVQYPTYGVETQIKIAKRKNNKVILLIHDLNILRNIDDNSILPLKFADIIIAHNTNMKDWLVRNGFKQPIIELEVFDYLSDKVKTEPLIYPKDKQFKICFAGNLNKSKFIDQLSFKHCKLRLFGIGIENIKINEGVEYIGCFHPEELQEHLLSHFGLVWDGTSCDTCNGVTGDYLRYIAPHKLSMYLCSNIPVIVWKESGMSDFVKRNNIGLVIENLNQLENILDTLSEEDYNKIIENVKKISNKIRTGFFTSRALKRIDNMIS